MNKFPDHIICKVLSWVAIFLKLKNCPTQFHHTLNKIHLKTYLQNHPLNNNWCTIILHLKTLIHKAKRYIIFFISMFVSIFLSIWDNIFTIFFWVSKSGRRISKLRTISVFRFLKTLPFAWLTNRPLII